MEEVNNEFREPCIGAAAAPKKRGRSPAAPSKKAQEVAASPVHGSPPPHSSLSPQKVKSRKKKQTNREMLEDMFDFHAAAAGAETTDDDAPRPPPKKGRGGGGGGRGKGRGARADVAAAAVSFVATPECYISKKERAEIERKFSKPKNDSQKKYARLLNDISKKIVIATGPAGTGKTLLAAEYAVRNFIFGEYEKIIFTRPSVSVDEDLGYLPGTLEEKMAPWMRPLYDILYCHFTARETAHMIEEKVIEICPLGFMRGRTFKNCCIICDEMQNSTAAQMKMLLTRIGEGSRLIITGDLDQCDRPAGYTSRPSFASTTAMSGSEKYAAVEYNGLEDFLRRFRQTKSESIVTVEFKKDDIEREPVVREVLDIYEKE